MAMIILDEFDKFREKYAKLTFEPLEITAVYRNGASRQNYQPQILDNLLAYQVMIRATNGKGLVDNPDCYDIPIPLKCLWRNKKGWPLWAASYFWPNSKTYQWSMVQHKRVITGHWSKGKGKNRKISLNKSAGKHKEKRIPVPVETSLDGEYKAVAIGHFESVCELLQDVVMLSGRRGIGLGTIDYFEVKIVDNVEIFLQNEKLSRAIPVEAVELLPKHIQITENYIPSVGWTPPQWKPTLFSAGWHAGTPVRIDYFEGI